MRTYNDFIQSNYYFNLVDYEFKKDIELRVKRAKDDVRITKAEVSSKVKSCDSSFLFNVELANHGSKDQKYAGLSIYNKELGINKIVDNIKIERFGDDDKYSSPFTFKLDKPSVKTYTLDVNAYIDKDETIAVERVKLSIVKCEEDKVESKTETKTETGKVDQTTTKKNTTPKDTSSKTTPKGSKITGGAIIKTVENPDATQNVIIATLGVAVVLLLIIIVIFGVILMRKQSNEINDNNDEVTK